MAELLEDGGDAGVCAVTAVAATFPVVGATITRARTVANGVKSSIAVVRPDKVSDILIRGRELHTINRG
jgi:hypothetical protein